MAEGSGGCPSSSTALVYVLARTRRGRLGLGLGLGCLWESGLRCVVGLMVAGRDEVFAGLVVDRLLLPERGTRTRDERTGESTGLVLRSTTILLRLVQRYQR